MTNRPAAWTTARRDGQRGQVLVLFTLMLIVLLLVSALAVDYGGWLVARRNYQNVSDAASLAGAQFLTRPLQDNTCPTGDGTKNHCARVAAWESIEKQLGFTGLDAEAQAAGPSDAAYVENGYSVWVASPPAEAGAAWLGRITGPGDIYVRVEHEGATYLSRIAGIGRTVTGWATAGRFPADFAVIGMCSSISVTERCLAGDANIKIDGSGSNLIVATGDLGTNRWVKTGGSSSGVALGEDSNAYMQLFDTCWRFATNQCQLWNYDGTNIDYSLTRTAIPLGAPIQLLDYPAPPTGSTETPNQCRGIGSAAVAVAPAAEGPVTAVEDLPIRLAANVVPNPQPAIVNAVATTNDLQGFVKDTNGNLLGGIAVSATNGTATYNMGNTGNNGPGKGRYQQNNLDSGTYTVTASDPSGVYAATTTTVTIPSASTNTTYVAPDIQMPKNPTISGTIRSSLGGTISGATISITGAGGPYNTTSGPGGAYGPVVISGWTATNTWNVNVSATNYTSNSVNSGFLVLNTNTVIDVTLTPAPASLTGTVTDSITGLPIPNVTVTLSGTNSGSTTTDGSGTYNFGSVAPGAGTTITLTNNLDGYMSGSPSSPTNPTTQSLNAGANTVNFAMWPKGCTTGSANRDKGNWECDQPSGADNCPAVINPTGPDVSCTFTDANAIRPGTYTNITISGGCAWLDPTGGATGLAPGQSGGVYHIKGTLDIRGDSYLFGDGVTLVFDQGANLDVANGGGFVLNYGTVKYSSTAGVCDPSTDLTTPKMFNDGTTPCFRTVNPNDGMDYAYAAWTNKSHALWSNATFPTYDSSVVVPSDGELGITFYFYCPPSTPECGLGNDSRMKLATANMGYLFNGVLYGPGDDIQLGGGKDGQTAAGQIVGWTIEYHGGTRILQNWYAPPSDGEPFLIEPVIGE